jgi:stearoyl-CoA desaturase (delta-9 desaturase)
MLQYGLLGPQPWWVPLLYVVVLGHITNLCVTLYLHRSATHEGVVFHPIVSHFMRFWLWLTTSVITQEWVACHRKHHAFSDREGDPHSPVQEGLLEIVFGGVFFYHEACKDQDMLEKYGKGCPTDWIENRLYSGRHHWWGILAMFIVDVALFGPLWGVFAWVSMAIWLPIFGNVINGVGHALGYRNFNTKDESHNIIPLGLLIVGEELHNNHHADPRSACFRAKWYEFDIGWVYIKMLSWVKLANVVYARSLSAKDFTEKYYTRAARAASVAAGELRASASAAAGELRASASSVAVELRATASARAVELRASASAAAGELRASASAAADELSAAAGELSAAAEKIAVPKSVRVTE